MSHDPRVRCCPGCGEPASDQGALFCEGCGAALDSSAAASPDAASLAPTAAAQRPSRPSVRGCRCEAPDPDADDYCQVCGLRTVSTADRFSDAADVSLALVSDRGLRHPTNQDHGAVVRRTDGAALIVVADGVSASDRPEAASRAATVAAVTAFKTWDGSGPISDLAREAVKAAGRAVVALRSPVEDQDGGPATTMVLAVVRPGDDGRPDSVAVAWVGDSRAYLVPLHQTEVLLTHDDCWAAQEVEAGRLSEPEALENPLAHAITEWLGMPEAEMLVHGIEVARPAGAVLLLCSDGLWNYFKAHGDLGRLIAGAMEQGAVALATSLCDFAVAEGGADNITAGLLLG